MGRRHLDSLKFSDLQKIFTPIADVCFACGDVATRKVTPSATPRVFRSRFLTKTTLLRCAPAAQMVRPRLGRSIAVYLPRHGRPGFALTTRSRNSQFEPRMGFRMSATSKRCTLRSRKAMQMTRSSCLSRRTTLLQDLMVDVPRGRS